MNAKTMGVFLISLTFLFIPGAAAQMMGEGMMKGGPAERREMDPGQMQMMQEMDQMMEMMHAMMRHMQHMMQDRQMRGEMDGMMKQMEQMRGRHQGMMKEGGMMQKGMPK